MVLYKLDSYQILTLSAILVPSLSTIWIIFLQRDLPEKIIVFKKRLKEYRIKKAEELLKRVLADIRDVKDSIDNGSEKYEMSLEIVMKHSDEWYLKSEAINRLLSKESEIYKIGRYVIIVLAVVFISGIYSSTSPDEIISGNISRIDATQIFFVVEIILIVDWIWIIFNFGFMLNKAQSGEFEDIEELIKDIVETIDKEN